MFVALLVAIGAPMAAMIDLYVRRKREGRAAGDGADSEHIPITTIIDDCVVPLAGDGGGALVAEPELADTVMKDCVIPLAGTLCYKGTLRQVVDRLNLENDVSLFMDLMARHAEEQRVRFRQTSV